MSRWSGGNAEGEWGYLKEIPEEPEVQARDQAGLPDAPLTVTRYRWVTPFSWGAELRGDASYPGGTPLLARSAP
jgi:hypothetical protein